MTDIFTIYIWGEHRFFPARIKIIRPPLHHRFTGFQMFSFVDISYPHAVAFLMTHLAFNSIL